MEDSVALFLELQADFVPFVIHVDEGVLAAVDVVLILNSSRSEDKGRKNVN